jgi:hypothetical protein
VSFLTPGTPNLADFLSFLSESVEVPAAALPPGWQWPQYALDYAKGLVLDPPCGIPAVIYTLAVYNLATHWLIYNAPDQVGQTWFKTQRGKSGFNLSAPTTGLVVGSSDEGSSVSLAEPEWAKGLTVGQLQLMGTPWGREYLDYIQKYGPGLVGLS